MNETHLHYEIFEQPAVVQRVLETEYSNARRVAELIRKRDIRYLTIAARGSSDNAALYGKYIFATLTRLPVALATPSLYTLYHLPPQLSNTLVIAISQSGESTDIIAVVEEAREQNVPTLAITNRGDSTLAQVCDEVFLLHAEEEKSIAATKTYTASLAALALLAVKINGSDERWNELRRVPDHISDALSVETQARTVANALANLSECTIIGRGYNHATAFELALKFKELAHLHAEPYSSADFLHGPFALVDERFRAFVYAPSGAVFENVVEFTQRIHNAGARVIGISDRPEFLEMVEAGVQLPTAVPEWVSPLVAIVPGQLLALHLTQAKGFNPDQPRGLSKVTKTL